MKDVAFFTALMAFALAALGAPAWRWFLFAAILFGVFA
jgi:hypothetical protein